jgi:ABC-2 type transport system permease protein
VNREHFLAFLWLRWRLRVNQFRKAGTLNTVFFFVFIVLALSAAVGLIVAGFLVGYLAMPQAPPWVHLLVWDGIISVFLFFWTIGLLSDLQRSEALAIDKVIHLPVSPSGAFLINYLSSLFSVTLIMFVPGMIGLILGQVFAGSVRMLLALPLLVAFVLAVTALTYQFQGWLASLMSNPRRRRTVIVIVTGAFILLAQVPNLINVARPWEGMTGTDSFKWSLEQRAISNADVNAKKITFEEYTRREKEIQKEFTERRAAETRQTTEKLEYIARTASLAFPPGWLAVGAADLAGGSMVASLLAILGFGLIGAFSLRRAYRTTLRLYTGEFTGQVRQSAAKPAEPLDPNRVRLVEWRLPWVSEHAAAVALAAFRSLSRAPEAKMALVAPFILLIVFAGGSLSAKADPPAALRPLIAIGTGAMVLLISGVQLIGNQFGYDRTGFRAYILSPVPRRDILLGKNLALAPLGVGMGLLLALLVGTVYPMRIDHYPAAAAQLVSTYMVFCLLANALSIAAPIPMASGSMQPAKVKAVPILLQFLFLAILPLAMIPVLIPIGVEVLLAEVADVRGWPVSLALSLLVLVVTVFVYRVVLRWEGDWLASREQAILEVVTSAE